jgi:hypothetical protein
MAENDDLNIQGAFDAGAQKMDLTDLEKKGFKKVKVLDQKAMEEFIRRAVDRVVSTQTAEEKQRIIEQSQKELDRLMKEHRAAKTKAQLLESNKNELAETIHALQRELDLKSELEEERLHKKFVEGTASMQAQVEEVKRKAQETAAALERVRVDNARLQAMLDAESEKVSQTSPKLNAALKDVQDLNRENARYQTELEGAGKRLNDLETSLEKEQSRLREAEHARTEMVEQVLKLQAKNAETSKSLKELDTLRAQLTRAEELVRDGARDNAALKSRVAELEEKAQKGLSDAARLEGENDPLRKEVAHLRSTAAALEKAAAEARSESQSGQAEAATLRGRLEAAESLAREKQAALERAEADIATFEKTLNEDRPRARAAAEEAAALRQELAQERSKSKAAADEAAAALERLKESKAQEPELRNRLAEADRIQIERVHLEQELTRLRSELAGLEPLRKERDAAREAMEEMKTEASSLRMEIARRDKLEEEQRERTIIVTSDLEAIEEKRVAEQEELAGLRQKSKSLEEELAATRGQLAQAHEEMKSLQEILQREQETAREVYNESTDAQATMQDLTSNAARLEEKVAGLLDQNQRLTERLRQSDVETAAASALDHRLAAVGRIMDQARELSAAARSAAADSRTAAAESRKTVHVQTGSPARKGGSRVQGGVALDGHALLQEFFRRIRLKERLQKHVPVREKDGQRHPSDMLIDVISALIAGDRRPDKERGPRLEILGAQRGPDIGDLRQFLDRIPPQASHAVSKVHAAMRSSLFSMPQKPDRLVLDVGSVDLPRSYRPLVAYAPEWKEFWHGELRTTSDKDSRGIMPFLKECLSKVPGGFPRSRVRFRLDSRYFSEDMVRFLNGRGCSYVMEAPDLKPIRDAAKKAKYYELSGGWEAAEFQQRIHPIRKTVGRFAVVRHRLSRKDRPDRPMFRDQTWEYCVFVVDSKISPWRAYQASVGRPASQVESAAMLTDFTKSKLLGRRRRSHAALFPLYLMASDLVQWFRRKALPMEERSRDLDNLRTELLRLPTTQERMGLQRLPVVAKNDQHRKSFDRVTRKLKRLRPVRPFTFRK